jgi:hypothetical protein
VLWTRREKKEETHRVPTGARLLTIKSCNDPSLLVEEEELIFHSGGNAVPNSWQQEAHLTD